jgi:hypothetical protein
VIRMLRSIKGTGVHPKYYRRGKKKEGIDLPLTFMIHTEQIVTQQVHGQLILISVLTVRENLLIKES